MKKVLIVLALICLVAFPVMAGNSYTGATKKNSVGVGLNLGTNTGVGLRFGMGSFDILANVGINNFSFKPFTLSADAAASYKVYTIDGGKDLKFPITVGVGAKAAIAFGDTTAVDLGVLVPVGIEYTFSEVPVTLYIRLAPGVKLLEATAFKIGFDYSGYIGALWNF